MSAETGRPQYFCTNGVYVFKTQSILDRARSNNTDSSPRCQHSAPLIRSRLDRYSSQSPPAAWWNTGPDLGRLGILAAPALQANKARTLLVPSSSCGIPKAAAYSANITSVAPAGNGPGWLAAWPAGTPWPGTVVMNAQQGGAIHNSAIIQASADGSIQVLSTGDTDLVIDIDGYFLPGAAGPQGPAGIPGPQGGSGTPGMPGDSWPTGHSRSDRGTGPAAPQEAREVQDHPVELATPVTTGPPGNDGNSGPAGSDGKTAWVTTFIASPDAAGNTVLSGSNLLAASIAACNEAASHGHALLKIEPGLYDLQAGSLNLCDKVDIEGSG